MKHLALGLLALFITQSLSAEELTVAYTSDLNESIQCFKVDAEISWKYCVHEAPGSSNRNIVFHFHGILGSEKNWSKKERYQRIRQHWANKRKDAPVVVSISFGRIWLLAEKNISTVSGLYEYFVEEVYPYILNKLNNYDGERILLGTSMGGFNTSQIMLKDNNLFDRYVLLCPIIAGIDLYSSDSEFDRYIEETGASAFRVFQMRQIAETYFPTQRAWDRAWQLKLAPTSFNEDSAPFHISCGQADEYGVHNSVRRFQEIALEKDAPYVVWQSLKGGHCTVDSDDVAEFITAEL